jgi:integrase
LELNLNDLPKVATPTLCRIAMRECREFYEPHWAKNTRKMHENSQGQHLDLFFGSMLLSDITARHINKYQRLRLEEDASNRTVNIELSLLRLTMRKHKLWANIAEDVRMLRENKDIGRELSDDEVERLLAACKANASRSLYPAVLVSMHTGLRNQELRLLLWRQVDLKGGTITVGKSKTKGGEGRMIPLSHTALRTLKDWQAQFPASLPDHYVFPRESYGLIGHKGLPGGVVAPYETFPDQYVQTFASGWRSAKKSAGVECRWHDLRHTFVSRIAAGGAMDGTLQAIAGWMSPKMIERYSHVRNQAKREAIAVLDQGTHKFHNTWRPERERSTT